MVYSACIADIFPIYQRKTLSLPVFLWWGVVFGDKVVRTLQAGRLLIKSQLIEE
jgi:hypothetical protein